MLLTRRSCRSFKPEQISDADLKTIINCGLNAPSGHNKQSVKIVIVQDAEKIRLLSRLNAQIMKTDSDPFYGAPTVCLILAPKNPAGTEPQFALNPVKDGSLVIGAMQDAAFALGVGSCWINRCKEMLELSEGQQIVDELGLTDYFGVGCCVLGYPDKTLGHKRIKPDRVLRW